MHGELLRSDYNEALEVDPNDLTLPFRTIVF